MLCRPLQNVVLGPDGGSVRGRRVSGSPRGVPTVPGPVGGTANPQPSDFSCLRKATAATTPHPENSYPSNRLRDTRSWKSLCRY